MITVKVFGLLRLESGIRELRLEAGSIKEVISALAQAGLETKDLEQSVILVNEKNANKRTKLKDGDRVVIMSPVAGG